MKKTPEVIEHPLTGQYVSICMGDGRQLQGKVIVVFDNGRASVAVGPAQLKRMTPYLDRLTLDKRA